MGRLGKQYYSLKEVRADGIKLSRANPKLYYTLFTSFGLYLEASKRLHIFAPDDAPMGIDYYFKNGKQKQFTSAQRIASQNATPTMS